MKKAAKAKPVKCKWTRRLLITPLKIIVGFYLFLYLFATVKPWLPGLGYTESMELVDVQISSGHYEEKEAWLENLLGIKPKIFIPDADTKKIKLKIPKSYLTPAYRDGGAVEYIKLEATYPDLKPWGAEYLKKPFTLDERREYVHIRIAEPRYTIEIPDHKDQVRVLGEYKGIMYGLNYFDQKPLLDNKGIPVEGWESQYFFSSLSKERQLRFRCVLPDEEGGVWCRGASDINDELYIEYTFLRSELKNWQQIDQNIKNLIQSFIVKD